MSRHERTALRARGSVHAGRLQPPPAKEPTAVEHLQVQIPLRPQEKPVAFPQKFADMLQEEYAIKYLQRLGALPTQENIAMVLKHLPLDDCQITSAWKARGSLADVVMVDLYPKPHTGIRLSPESEESESSTGVASAKSNTRKQRMYAAASAQNESVADTLTNSKSYQIGSVCMSFDDMKHQYLLPFKHGMRHEADVLTMFAMKHEEPVTFAHIPALAETHTKPTLQLFGRRATQRRIKCIEERVRPPEIRAEFTTHMLRAFITALPFGALGVRSDVEQHTLSELLLHDDLVALTEATVRYLYLQVFFKLGCLGAVDLIKSTTIQAYHRNAPTEIEALYVTIVRIFDTIKLRMEREEKGTTLFLPLHLLALRVAVETVFRCQYPVSFNVTAPTMQYILAEMNDQITKVLDGDLLLSRIGILETTCESAKIMASHAYQVKKRRARLRDQYFQTSEAIHTIFPNPISGKCRKMIKFRGGAAIGNYPLAVVEPTECDSVDASARGDATSDNNQSAHPSRDASAFAKSTRTAALPGASLETRLELLHLMERSRVQAQREPKRPVVLLPPPQRQAKTAR